MDPESEHRETTWCTQEMAEAIIAALDDSREPRVEFYPVSPIRSGVTFGTWRVITMKAFANLITWAEEHGCSFAVSPFDHVFEEMPDDPPPILAVTITPASAYWRMETGWRPLEG
jgi:hypothetical protein